MTKDKLVKFNHKAPYYRLRKFSISFAAFLGLSVSVALPVSIELANAKAENPHAQENTSENTSEEKNNETLDEQLESY